MYHVIWLVDFSEPLQYSIPPLAYLIVLSLDPGSRLKKWWLHFIPFALYFVYFLPFYFAPPGYKEESYYFIHHLVPYQTDNRYNFLWSWGMLRRYQLYACFFQTTVYMVLSFQWLSRYKKLRTEYPEINPWEVNWWIFFNITIVMLIVVVITVKVSFTRDLGDHIIAAFFTFIIYLATLAELIKPGGDQKKTQVSLQKVDSCHFTGSDLKQEKKEEIYRKLISLMEDKNIYRDKLISLARVAKQTGEPAYIVSQVINEKMNVSFFEWIAKYRVEEAKRILSDSSKKSFTVEQVAEEVGYNSKSAFNKVFKKFTGKTPSEYKNS